MEFTPQRNIQTIGLLLIALAVTQAVYTGLYIAEANIPRQALWGLEGLLFVMLAAFGGAAMVESKQFTLAWSAIAASAVLNVVQVGVGLTMFGPFREAAENVEALAPAATAVVAFSFFVYNAAKVLLGFAALIIGGTAFTSNVGGTKLIGGAAALFGILAMLSNTTVMALGRDNSALSTIAGGSGVVATLLLAICILVTLRKDEP